MNGTTILLVVISLMLSVSLASGVLSPSPELEPIDESQVQVHWIKQGEPAPFDGILLNDYTYERMRLKLGE